MKDLFERRVPLALGVLAVALMLVAPPSAAQFKNESTPPPAPESESEPPAQAYSDAAVGLRELPDGRTALRMYGGENVIIERFGPMQLQDGSPMGFGLIRLTRPVSALGDLTEIADDFFDEMLGPEVEVRRLQLASVMIFQPGQDETEAASAFMAGYQRAPNLIWQRATHTEFPVRPSKVFPESAGQPVVVESGETVYVENRWRGTYQGIGDTAQILIRPATPPASAEDVVRMAIFVAALFHGAELEDQTIDMVMVQVFGEIQRARFHFRPALVITFEPGGDPEQVPGGPMVNLDPGASSQQLRVSRALTDAMGEVSARLSHATVRPLHSLPFETEIDPAAFPIRNSAQ